MALLVGFGAVLLALGDERPATLLRFWAIVAAAGCAVVPPHLLFPDPRLRLAHLLNLAPPDLLAYQAGRWARIVGVLLVPGVVLAYVDPGAWSAEIGLKTAHLVETGLVVVGAAGFSLAHYAHIGPRSQAWQEGRAGGRYRYLRENTPLYFAVPDGLAPALFATAFVFGLALIAIVAAAALSRGGALLGGLPGLALVGLGALRLARLRPVYDRYFYQTNAFYAEIFRSAGGVRVGEREAIPYRAVYWAPEGQRPHVWAALRQLDRRLPLGRLVALSHLVLWLLVARGAGPLALAAYLLVQSAAKNAAALVLAWPSFAPPPFHLGLQPPRGWVATRFFANLRWTLPLLLSLLAVAFFADGFTYAQALAWVALDAGLALGAAALVTLATEGRYRRRLA